TMAGVVVGTPAYMAPEQAVQDPVSPATDLYSLAIILYEMVLGAPPFRSDRTLDLIQMQVREIPDVPHRLLPSLPALLVKGLEKRPADRIASAAEFLAALNQVEAELAVAGSFFGAGAAADLTAAGPGPARVTAKLDAPSGASARPLA